MNFDPKVFLDHLRALGAEGREGYEKLCGHIANEKADLEGDFQEALTWLTSLVDEFE